MNLPKHEWSLPVVSLRRFLLVLALSVVVQAADAADINSGARIYQTHCASCHGPTGISIVPGTPNFARGEALMKPDVVLLATVRMGLNAMPAYIGILSDRQILDSIAYSRTLR
jgi:cytochrome c6